MVRKRLSQLLVAAGALVLLSTAAQVPAQPEGAARQALSEEAVQRTLKAVEAASRSKDVEGVLKYVAPFAYLENTLDALGYAQTIKVVGKEQIRAQLAEAYERIESSEYLDRSQKVFLLPDGQAAIVNNDSIVNVTLKDGRRLLVNGRDTYVLGLVNGQLVLTSATTIRSASVRPKAKATR